MNESKYPKSLSTLLALNLCALLTMLILSMDEIGDGTCFVSGMTGMQSIVCWRLASRSYLTLERTMNQAESVPLSPAKTMQLPDFNFWLF